MVCVCDEGWWVIDMVVVWFVDCFVEWGFGIVCIEFYGWFGWEFGVCIWWEKGRGWRGGWDYIDGVLFYWKGNC